MSSPRSEAGSRHQRTGAGYPGARGIARAPPVQASQEGRSGPRKGEGQSAIKLAGIWNRCPFRLFIVSGRLRARHECARGRTERCKRPTPEDSRVWPSTQSVQWRGSRAANRVARVCRPHRTSRSAKRRLSQRQTTCERPSSTDQDPASTRTRMHILCRRLSVPTCARVEALPRYDMIVWFRFWRSFSLTPMRRHDLASRRLWLSDRNLA